MGLTPGLRLRGTQRLALTPALRQGLRLLSLPRADLMATVQEEMARNPLLVGDLPPAGGLVRAGPGGAHDIALETVAAEQSPAQLLARQLAGLHLSEPVLALARWLAADLDDRGYLVATGAEIAAETGADPDSIAAAIAALHRCEPAGIGARDLAECLALQLAARGHPPERARAIAGALRPLARGDWAAARRLLGGTPAEMQALAAELSRLDPAPGRTLAPAAPEYRLPDLAVGPGPDGAPVVRLIDDGLGGLRLDRGLLDQLLADGAARAAAEAHRQSAETLLNAIRFRGQTLLRVGRALVEAQMPYFTGQRPHPAPLTRAAIADRLGLHPSTVGRAIAARALDWQGRVHPLEWFFPTPLGPGGEGPGPSARDAEAEILRLVRQETAQTVLSDDALAARLTELGVDIARRTVAKYRKGLNIPPSHLRRRALLQARPGPAGGGRRTTGR